MKAKEFSKAVEVIKSLGYEVYIPKASVYEYGYFTDGTNIGYFQCGRWGGITFSTRHVPCRECGTSFCIISDDDAISPENITKEVITSCFVIAPEWAKTYGKYVKKYKSFNEFVKHPLNSMSNMIKA